MYYLQEQNAEYRCILCAAKKGVSIHYFIKLKNIQEKLVKLESQTVDFTQAPVFWSFSTGGQQWPRHLDLMVRVVPDQEMIQAFGFKGKYGIRQKNTAVITGTSTKN